VNYHAHAAKASHLRPAAGFGIWPLMPAASESRAARKARYTFYIVGALFGALGMALELVPLFASVTPTRVAKACALLGAVILAVGRFSPDRFVERCDALLSRR